MDSARLKTSFRFLKVCVCVNQLLFISLAASRVLCVCVCVSLSFPTNSVHGILIISTLNAHGEEAEYTYILESFFNADVRNTSICILQHGRGS
jgi:hypothetical protein